MPEGSKIVPDEVQTDNLVMTENYEAWISHEPDGETFYHLELGAVTIHLLQEEWDEVVELVRAAAEEVRKRNKR
jgi:hypothetical protein